MDAETRKAIAELTAGMDNIADLLSQLSQLICYAEGITLVEVNDEDDFPEIEGNA